MRNGSLEGCRDRNISKAIGMGYTYFIKMENIDLYGWSEGKRCGIY